MERDSGKINKKAKLAQYPNCRGPQQSLKTCC